MTGTGTYTPTDLVAVIPEYWLPVVLEAFFAKTVAANFFLDFTDMASGGHADIFHVANIFTNVLTSATKTTASEVALNSPSTVDTTITATTWETVAFLIEDNELQQALTSHNILERLSEQAGARLADNLEDNLFALWSGVATTVGTTSAAVTDIQIRQCIRQVEDNADGAIAPKDNRAFFFYPITFWDQIMGLAKFYDASQSGWGYGGQAPIVSGNFGPFDRSRGLVGALYGDPVFTTTNVVSSLSAYRNLYAHRDAFGFLTRTPGGNRVRIQSRYVLENLGVLVVADIIYGSAELRDLFAVVLNGSTTATA